MGRTIFVLFLLFFAGFTYNHLSELAPVTENLESAWTKTPLLLSLCLKRPYDLENLTGETHVLKKSAPNGFGGLIWLYRPIRRMGCVRMHI